MCPSGPTGRSISHAVPARAGSGCRPGRRRRARRISPVSSRTIADLDPRLAEAVGLRLDVGDVDMRDAARRSARPPRGRSPSRRAAAPTSARRSRRRSSNPSVVRVEARACVEVADVVPDGCLGDLQRERRVLEAAPSASGGSRRAGAPSTARWSNVPRQRHHRPHDGSPSTATTRSSVAPTATIAACGGLSTAVKLSTRVHAEVRDRERAALEVLRAQLASRARPTSVGARGRRSRRAEPLGAADHRHDEALRRGDGDADVRARVEEDRVLGELRVHLAVPHERLRARPS